MLFFRLADLAIEMLIPMLTGLATIFLLIHQHEMTIRHYEQDQRIAEDQRQQDRRIRQLDREEDLRMIELQRQQDLQNDELQRQLDREIAKNETETRRKLDQQYRDLLEEYRRKDIQIVLKNRIEDQQREQDLQRERSILRYIDDVFPLVSQYQPEKPLESKAILLTIQIFTRSTMRSLDPSRRHFLAQLMSHSPLNLPDLNFHRIPVLYDCDLRAIQFGTPILHGLSTHLQFGRYFHVSKSDLHKASFLSINFTNPTSFNEVIMVDTLWRDVIFDNVMFNRGSLRNAKFENVIISNVTFERIDLSGVSFRLDKTGYNARFESQQMVSADFSRNSWKNIYMTSMTIHETNLSYSQFNASFLEYLTARKLDLSNSIFTSTIFLGANFYQCQMQNSKFINVTFTQSNLTACQGLRESNTKNTRFIKTLLPNGTLVDRLCMNCR